MQAPEPVDDDEAMDSLMGRRLVSWERGDVGVHIELDDGRTLILMGFLGILSPVEGSFH